MDSGDPINRYEELSSEFRALLFAGAQSACPTRVQSPEPNGRAQVERLDGLSSQISASRLARYYRVWIVECAPWLDMFDESRTFGLQVPCLAQESPSVRYALLALAARQVERQSGKKGPSYDSLELYANAIAALSVTLDASDQNTIVTACILCVLEMMSASSEDWRKHLEGCAALFEASAVHGLCGGVKQAVFWCFARMDLCGAIMAFGAASTVVPLSKWALVHMEGTSETADERTIRKAFQERQDHVVDMHANYMVYLCARVCDLTALRTRYLELGESNGYDTAFFSSRWSRAQADLQDWYNTRPAAMLPLTTWTGPHGFHCAFFPSFPAISSNQLYHTACILMSEVKPSASSANSINSVVWHARHIVGISLANAHRGCLNNAIQPLYVAGKLFTHRREHDIVVRLLDLIESSSGWVARWRINDLERVWGYPPETFS